jgi:hypothetical protein
VVRYRGGRQTKGIGQLARAQLVGSATGLAGLGAFSKQTQYLPSLRRAEGAVDIVSDEWSGTASACAVGDAGHG